MKVVLLAIEWPSPGTHVGGVGRYAYRLAVELRDRVDLTVVTLEGGEPLRDVAMVTIRKPRSRFERFYVVPFLARRKLHALSADIVHALGDDWALRTDDAFHVRTFLGSSLREARSSSGLRKLNHYVLWVTEKIAQWRIPARLAIAPDSFEEFDAQYLVPPIARFPLPQRQPSTIPTAVFIGSFGGRKRGYLAEEAVEIAGSLLNSRVELHVIGPGSDARNWGKQTVHHSGLADGEVQALISKSWVLLAPSAYEGFGIPAFEALALQTPVIATMNPGVAYLRSQAAADSEAIVIVADDDLPKAIVNRIIAGPYLRDADRVDAELVTESLYESSSIDNLVNNVYANRVSSPRHNIRSRGKGTAPNSVDSE